MAAIKFDHSQLTLIDDYRQLVLWLTPAPAQLARVSLRMLSGISVAFFPIDDFSDIELNDDVGVLQVGRALIHTSSSERQAIRSWLARQFTGDSP